MRSISLLPLAVAAVLAMPAQADDSTVLLESGNWLATINVDDDDGSLYCTADTASGQTSLVLVGGPDVATAGVAAVLVNDTWNLGQRKVTGYVDVDYIRFNMEGEADGTALIMHQLTSDFLRALQGGTAIAFHNAEGLLVETFSLDGSRDVIGEWAQCIARLTPTTPAATADPFAATGPTF